MRSDDMTKELSHMLPEGAAGVLRQAYLRRFSYEVQESEKLDTTGRRPVLRGQMSTLSMFSIHPIEGDSQ